MKPQDLCALICAYNEESTISDIVSRTRAQVGKVFVLDDGSRDKTRELAKAAGAEVISLPSNQGKGQALRTGFSYLSDKPYQGVITLDADGQHLPEEIPGFLKKLNQGYDAVIGKRNFHAPEVPVMRKIGNSLYSLSLSRINHQPVYDPECGYRAFRTEILPSLADVKTDGFTYEAEVLVCLLRGQFKIGWTDISTVYIPGRKSKIKPVQHTLNSIKFCLRCMHRS